jgi:NAD+ kinase
VDIARVAFVVHPTKPEAARMRDEIQDVLGQRGITIDEKSPDLVLALGGDGTMLHAAHAAHAAMAPLLGVNFGSLGYLTEVEAGEELGALKRVLDGDYRLEQRMMLDCRVTSDGQEAHLVGLNEVRCLSSARRGTGSCASRSMSAASASRPSTRTG